MTRQVISVQVDDKMSRVRRTMSDKGIHHVPILDGSNLVGIISARDLLQLSDAELRKGDQTADEAMDERCSIRDVMQTGLVTIRENEGIGKAIDVLADGSIHSILVLDQEDRMVGIVTNIDLLGYLFA
jgi:CBS-domain-containing membrane protein